LLGVLFTSLSPLLGLLTTHLLVLGLLLSSGGMLLKQRGGHLVLLTLSSAAVTTESLGLVSINAVIVRDWQAIHMVVHKVAQSSLESFTSQWVARLDC
jgi:hypothetical protein